MNYTSNLSETLSTSDSLKGSTHYIRKLIQYIGINLAQSSDTLSSWTNNTPSVFYTSNGGPGGAIDVELIGLGSSIIGDANYTSTPINVLPNTTYTFSAWVDTTYTSNTNFCLEIIDVSNLSNDVVYKIPEQTLGRVSASITFGSVASKAELRFQTESSSLAQLGKIVKWSQPQFEIGSVASSYTVSDYPFEDSLSSNTEYLSNLITSLSTGDVLNTRVIPLGYDPLQESNIMNSLKDYINVTIVNPYNLAVSGTTYSNPLGIMLERPSDPQVQPVLPLVVLGYPEESVPPKSTGIGDGTLWYYENYHIMFYPAMDSSNSPIARAAALLRSYTKYALSSALFIPIYDYMVDPPEMFNQMQVMNVRMTKAVGRMDNILGIDRYRFDIMLECRYVITAING